MSHPLSQNRSVRKAGEFSLNPAATYAKKIEEYLGTLKEL